MRAGFRTSIAAVMLAIPVLAAAADDSRPAYVPPPPAVSSGGIVQIIFSLLLVLAAIFLVVWLLKRMNMVQQGHGNLLKVLGGVAIGQRERIVLVEVNDTWLVVGVGPNQIRTLHSLQKPDQAEGSEGSDVAAPVQPGGDGGKFAALLSSALNSLPAGKRNAP